VSKSPSGYVTIFGEASVPTPGLEGGVGCNPRMTFDGKVRNLGPCVLKLDSPLPEDHRFNILSTTDFPRHHWSLRPLVQLKRTALRGVKGILFHQYSSEEKQTHAECHHTLPGERRCHRGSVASQLVAESIAVDQRDCGPDRLDRRCGLFDIVPQAVEHSDTWSTASTTRSAVRERMPPLCSNALVQLQVVTVHEVSVGGKVESVQDDCEPVSGGLDTLAREAVKYWKCGVSDHFARDCPNAQDCPKHWQDCPKDAGADVHRGAPLQMLSVQEALQEPHTLIASFQTQVTVPWGRNTLLEYLQVAGGFCLQNCPFPI
jgi:hypothetical protein